MGNYVAPPLEWHPAYRDKPWLLDWLNLTGPYADRDVLRLPVTSPIRFTSDPNPEPETLTTRQLTMTRQKAAGPAPYVGRPFCYVWYVGVDNLGRQIAGESRIVYLGEWWQWEE